MNAGMNVSNNNDPRLYEKIKELEDIRSRAIAGVILLIAGGTLFFFGGPLLHASRNAFVLPLFGMLVGVIGAILLLGTRKKYKAAYKSLFVEKQLRYNFQNVVYDWKSGFHETAVKTFGLCAMGNRFSSEDYLRGEFAGIPFETSDVTVQQVTSTGKSTHVTTYFKGRMLVFDFPSKFVNSVQIFTDNYRYRGKPMINMRPQKVEMEGVDFNKRFDVFALSPHDAFYLLTPQFMEDMMALSSRYNSMAVHVAGNRVFVGFNEPFHDAFDADSMLKKISYPDEMQAIQRDIDDIKNFITIIRGIYNNYNAQNNYNVQPGYNTQNNYNNYNANDYYQTV
ncbi:MAG: DUF3137 domain-containing protein [Eubacterium sp.]|nr:DUF3137 domain-containing protein [Eubacterium sp.]